MSLSPYFQILAVQTKAKLTRIHIWWLSIIKKWTTISWNGKLLLFIFHFFARGNKKTHPVLGHWTSCWFFNWVSSNNQKSMCHWDEFEMFNKTQCETFKRTPVHSAVYCALFCLPASCPVATQWDVSFQIRDNYCSTLHTGSAICGDLKPQNATQIPRPRALGI